MTSHQSAAEPCAPVQALHTKGIAFVGIMSALGVVLGAISTFGIPILPGVVVDLSHVGTYIVALAGGPVFGLCAGAIVGVIPSFAIGNPMIIPGKMMTGVTVGFACMLLKRVIPKATSNKVVYPVIILISGIVGYIPEYIFTVWNLTYVVGLPEFVITSIVTKAWTEIFSISILMAVLFGIPAIKDGIASLIGNKARLSPRDYIVSSIVLASSILCMMVLLLLPVSTVRPEWATPDLMVQSFLGWLVGAMVVLGVLVVILLVRLKQDERATCPAVA